MTMPITRRANAEHYHRNLDQKKKGCTFEEGWYRTYSSILKVYNMPGHELCSISLLGVFKYEQPA